MPNCNQTTQTGSQCKHPVKAAGMSCGANHGKSATVAIGAPSAASAAVAMADPMGGTVTVAPPEAVPPMVGYGTVHIGAPQVGAGSGAAWQTAFHNADRGTLTVRTGEGYHVQFGAVDPVVAAGCREGQWVKRTDHYEAAKPIVESAPVTAHDLPFGQDRAIEVSDAAWDVSYDPYGKALSVTYRDAAGGPGGSYVYDGVEHDTFARFVGAPSRGRFLATRIKPLHTFQKTG